MTIDNHTGLVQNRPYTMKTWSGRYVDPFAFTAADIHWADIAHSLAYQCRFNGHSSAHLSVARHSLEVCMRLEQSEPGFPALHLAGLLHDAAEAYIGDLITPLKHHPAFAFFRELDDTITRVIFEAAGLGASTVDDWTSVKEADRVQTVYEVKHGRFEVRNTPQRYDEIQFHSKLIDLLNRVYP